MKKILLIFLTISLLLLVSCDYNQNNMAKGSLSAGFSGEESPPVWLGFTSDKTKIKKGEDLTLKVYYGTILNYPDGFTAQFDRDGVSPETINVDFIIRYGRFSKELIQSGKNIFEKPEYTLIYTMTGEIVYKPIEKFGVDLYPMLGENSQYEKIVLSSDLFGEEIGYISFIIKINGVYQGVLDNENSTGGSISLSYKFDDDCITLYDSYYDFFNSIIN